MIRVWQMRVSVSPRNRMGSLDARHCRYSWRAFEDHDCHGTPIPILSDAWAVHGLRSTRFYDLCTRFEDP